eukprot:c9184_g1_i1.p1 GENE.c9184_g1_i1~~c9184_g1_i1.p1  ORF type:complete len:192 (+),score=75.56 c9184_g1_i1:29-577(+)
MLVVVIIMMLVCTSLGLLNTIPHQQSLNQTIFNKTTENSPLNPFFLQVGANSTTASTNTTSGPDPAVVALQAIVANHDKQIADLKSSIEQQTATITKQAAQLTAAEAKIETHGTEISEIKSRIDAIEKELVEVQDHLTKHDDTLEQHDTHLTEIDELIEDISEKIANVMKGLTAGPALPTKR